MITIGGKEITAEMCIRDSIREEHGEKYSPVLTPRNEARDVTLHFALYNKTQAGWMKQYFALSLIHI